MNRVTVIVGAGGTGSYVVPSVANLYHADENNNIIVLIDGDVVENKNLLRQGFLRKDLNGNKAEVLAKRYSEAFPELAIYYSKGFVNDVNAVLHVVDNFSEIDEIVLISCVDNNYARLRLWIAQFQLYSKYGCNVHFIDAGNEEWHGQVIPCSLYRGNENPMQVLNNRATIHEDACNGHKLDSIFVGIENWRDRLTRGDHELSCDEVTVSHPQNIGTNMMAAVAVSKALKQVLDAEEVTEVRFNSRSNKFTVAAGSTDEQVVNRLKDVCSFVNAEGADIFGDSRIPVIPTNESVAERFQRARVQVEKKPVTEQKGFEDILGIFDDELDDEDDLFANVKEPEEKKEDFEDWLLEFLED